MTEQAITESMIECVPITKPITEKPITEKPITEKPITEKPITEKPITEILLYADSSMPEYGWIQSCLNCYAYTAAFLVYKKVETPENITIYKSIVCPDCLLMMKRHPQNLNTLNDIICKKYPLIDKNRQTTQIP